MAASVAQSSKQAPFTSVLWDRGFESRYGLMCGLMWKESVNALPKVVGFLRVLQKASHRESWQGGLG
jgi:hypothetical protein